MFPFGDMGFEQEGHRSIPILPPIDRKPFERPVSPVSTNEHKILEIKSLGPLKYSSSLLYHSTRKPEILRPRKPMKTSRGASL
jgi:hypothetical protein